MCYLAIYHYIFFVSKYDSVACTQHIYNHIVVWFSEALILISLICHLYNLSPACRCYCLLPKEYRNLLKL